MARSLEAPVTVAQPSKTALRALRSLLAPSLLLGLGVGCGDGLIDTKFDEDAAGIDGVPNVFVDATVIDFGRVPRGVSAPAPLNVANTGTGTLTVLDLTFTGAEFSASGGAGITVSPGASIALSLRYLPVDFEDDVGELVVTTDDPDEPTFTVSLRGAVVVDGDGDGFASRDAGGDDCDDEDPLFYPGAPDDWYDGRDTNCDGLDDFDQDGDGFQTAAFNPEGGTGGGDCQDANPDMFPGAADSWYDGVDSDCDGSNDYDADGDGYGSAAMGVGSDCDDGLFTVNPDGIERLNGLDDDCDGNVDSPVDGTIADLEFYGVQSNDAAGWQITTGDLDGDGTAELVVGAPLTAAGRGAVSIFTAQRLPADGSDMQDAFNYIPGDGTADRLGWDVSIFDNAGLDEQSYLAIGAPYINAQYGRIYVLSGYDARYGASLSSAALRLEGTGGSNGYWVGRGISQGVELDGDGIEDMLGWYQTTTSTVFQPHVFLLYGDRWSTSSATTLTLASVDARWATDGGNSSAYSVLMDKNFGMGGDFDGDGLIDWLHCDNLSDGGGTDGGTVWALWGSTTRYSSPSATSFSSTASRVVSGLVSAQFANLCTVGDDMDGDGDNEIWTYSTSTGELAMYAGGAGLRSAALSATTDPIATYDFGVGATPPKSLRLIHDVDGDGVRDVAFGASNGTGGDLYIFDGAAEGDFDGDEAMAWLEGSGDADLPAFQVELGGTIAKRSADLNRDGKLDLILGDAGYGINTTLITRGAVFVNYGQ